VAFLFTTIFWVAFVGGFFGVFLERIVMGRLSHVRNKDVQLAFTQKARLQLLEDYKTECGKGREDLWYKYLMTVYTHGMKFVWFMLALGVLAIAF
jgi:hypothetical protein